MTTPARRFYLLRARFKNGTLKMAWTVIQWKDNRTLGTVHQLEDGKYQLHLAGYVPMEYDTLDSIRVALPFIYD